MLCYFNTVVIVLLLFGVSLTKNHFKDVFLLLKTKNNALYIDKYSNNDKNNFVRNYKLEYVTVKEKYNGKDLYCLENPVSDILNYNSYFSIIYNIKNINCNSSVHVYSEEEYYQQIVDEEFEKHDVSDINNPNFNTLLKYRIPD